MGITIRKMKQPVDGSFMKKDMVFYRVKNNGVYIKDFKTKSEAKKFIIKFKKGNAKL